MPNPIIGYAEDWYARYLELWLPTNPALFLPLRLMGGDNYYQDISSQINNKSFENGDPPDDWTTGGTGGGDTIDRDNTHAYDGTDAARLVYGNNGCYLYQVLPSWVNGGSYKCTAWGWTATANRFNITVNDGVDNHPSSNCPGTSTWEQMATEYTINDASTRHRLLGQVKTGAITAWLDYVELYRKLGPVSPFGSPPLTLDGAVFRGHRGLWFDGINDLARIAMGDLGKLDFVNDFTIDIVFTPADVSGTQILLWSTASVAVGFVNAEFGFTNLDNADMVSGGVVIPNKPNHAQITKSSGNGVLVALNGAAVGSSADTTNVAPWQSTQFGESTGLGGWFEGYIDTVVIRPQCHYDALQKYSEMHLEGLV